MSDAPYTVGTWAGMPNYQCALCPYATLNEADILEHWQARHAAAPPEPIGGGLVLVADKSGHEVAPAPLPAKKRGKRETMEVYHGREIGIDSAADSAEIPGPATGGELG